MSGDGEPWGISLEWDEDGLECCTWAFHRTGNRLEFDGEASAQMFIDKGLLRSQGPDDDLIATPRQFT